MGQTPRNTLIRTFKVYLSPYNVFTVVAFYTTKNADPGKQFKCLSEAPPYEQICLLDNLAHTKVGTWKGHLISPSSTLSSFPEIPCRIFLPAPSLLTTHQPIYLYLPPPHLRFSLLPPLYSLNLGKWWPSCSLFLDFSANLRDFSG